MKRLSFILVLFSALSMMVTSCDVHEFPELPEKVQFHLKLHYATDMPQWEYPITSVRSIVPSKSVQTAGEMRYIIRLYPQDAKSSACTPSQEFVFTRDVAEGYDAEFTLEAPAGNYTVMVWSDLAENAGGGHRFYNTEDFLDIALQGDHAGNNDYRDAFRGTHSLTLTSGITETEPETAVIEMERPLAKFEFVTTDVEKFIDKEIQAAISRGEITENAPASRVDVEDYKVVFYYVGFMPSAYSMFTDKPVNSVTGISFAGRLASLNESEASMGFDYVFVNGTESAVTVQVGIFDKDGNRLSMSESVRVPLRRSKHTVLKGKFLMQNASGGVSINPDYDGDHNIIL